MCHHQVLHCPKKARKKNGVRVKMWQLDPVYHCTIIGMCLTLAEIKTLLYSLNIDCYHYHAYEIHTHVVTVMGTNNLCSKKIQHYLDKKFSEVIKKTLAMTTDELALEWTHVLGTVDLIGTFWALISHPNTTEKMKKFVYGDIHMLSHASELSYHVTLKRLEVLESIELQQLEVINAQKQQIKKLMQAMRHEEHQAVL
ncbi:MAG: hypothetical protein KAG26_05160 [Methylococcales bacterium]|nr:hypothetical protein [Methylococcales bacterium]